MITIPLSWIELNQSVFNYNISHIRSLVGSSVIIASVIKANAYGHGMKEMAILVGDNKEISYGAVFTLSEAILLRSWGFKKKIIILGCFFDLDPAKIVIHDIEVMVDDFKNIRLLDHIARIYNKKIKIHVKIDTGLTRFGFFPHEVEAAIISIISSPHLHLEGVGTHFAESVNSDEEYTQKQRNSFFTILKALEKKGYFFARYHIDKSETIMESMKNEQVMVRLGLATYGLLNNTRQIMTWKTKIIHIREVPAQTFVGYGRTYITEGFTKLALLPVGYADGLQVELSNKTEVLIERQEIDSSSWPYAPIVGKIAMNITTIDVTHIPDIALGDVVILLGDYHRVRIIDRASYSNSHNPREITTKISPLIPRIIDHKKFTA